MKNKFKENLEISFMLEEQLSDLLFPYLETDFGDQLIEQVEDPLWEQISQIENDTLVDL